VWRSPHFIYQKKALELRKAGATQEEAAKEVGVTQKAVDKWEQGSKTARRDEVPCFVTTVKSEAELQMIAVAKNSKHGKQLSPDEKKSYAIRWWKNVPDDESREALSIDERTYQRWTKNKREEFEALEAANL
jgi:transcriptional regulator with XRE-family HTH domain